MSGLKPPELVELHRRLRARGLATAELAKLVGVSRPALTRVLNGSRRPGPIFRRLEWWLDAEELRLWHVVQTSTWNQGRAWMRPRWRRIRF